MPELTPSESGDLVCVMSGRFASFRGVVGHVNEARSRLKVAVSIHGRVAAVDLKFSDVTPA